MLGEELGYFSDFSSSGLISLSVFSICGFHDSGEKAQQLMKEFFLFNLIGLSKTSPLGMATLSWTSSSRLPLIAVLFGPGRITVAVLGVLSLLFTALDVLLWTFYFSGMAVLTLRGTLRRQPNF